MNYVLLEVCHFGIILCLLIVLLMLRQVIPKKRRRKHPRVFSLFSVLQATFVAKRHGNAKVAGASSPLAIDGNNAAQWDSFWKRK
jgi:hypothetical protein